MLAFFLHIFVLHYVFVLPIFICVQRTERSYKMMIHTVLYITNMYVSPLWRNPSGKHFGFFLFFFFSYKYNIVNIHMEYFQNAFINRNKLKSDEITWIGISNSLTLFIKLNRTTQKIQCRNKFNRILIAVILTSVEQNKQNHFIHSFLCLCFFFYTWLWVF